MTFEARPLCSNLTLCTALWKSDIIMKIRHYVIMTEAPNIVGLYIMFHFIFIPNQVKIAKLMYHSI